MNKYKTYHASTEWYDGTDPLLYLGGSEEDWKDKAIEMLLAKDIKANIADPRNIASANHGFDVYYDWRIYHQRIASVNGCLLFWIDKGCSSNITKHEVAEWICHLKYRRLNQPDRPLKLILGVEPGYGGEDYIKYRMADDLPGFIVFDSLEDACSGAVKFINGE